MKNCSMYHDNKGSAKPTRENTLNLRSFHNHEYELLTNHTAKEWRLHNNPITLANAATTKEAASFGTPFKAPDSYATLKQW